MHVGVLLLKHFRQEQWTLHSNGCDFRLFRVVLGFFAAVSTESVRLSHKSSR